MSLPSQLCEPRHLECFGFFILEHMTAGSVLKCLEGHVATPQPKHWNLGQGLRGVEGRQRQGVLQNNPIYTCHLLYWLQE